MWVCCVCVLCEMCRCDVSLTACVLVFSSNTERPIVLLKFINSPYWHSAVKGAVADTTEMRRREMYVREEASGGQSCAPNSQSSVGCDAGCKGTCSRLNLRMDTFCGRNYIQPHNNWPKQYCTRIIIISLVCNKLKVAEPCFMYVWFVPATGELPQ